MLLGPLLGATTGACFTAPAGNVLFSCDPNVAPTCPGGYTCQADGCCHKDGSDLESSLGACRELESGTGASTAGTGIPTLGGGSSGADTGTDTGSAGTTEGGSTGDTGTDTGTSSGAT